MRQVAILVDQAMREDDENDPALAYPTSRSTVVEKVPLTSQSQHKTKWFDALCDLIIEFDFSVEGVESCPALGQGDSSIGVFSFEFSGNGASHQTYDGWSIPALGS